MFLLESGGPRKRRLMLQMLPSVNAERTLALRPQFCRNVQRALESLELDMLDAMGIAEQILVLLIG